MKTNTEVSVITGLCQYQVKIAGTMTEDVLKKGLSKVGNLIKGYGTLGLDAGWLAAGYAKTIFPKLKSQLPEGAKITKPNNRIGAGVGLIPH